MLTVDDLAQEIRRVDGNHSLGAGALAEALMPFLSAALSIEQTQPVKVKASPSDVFQVLSEFYRNGQFDFGHAPEMSRRLSALVDVQAVEPEPVGEHWCAFENGHQHTSWYPDGYGDRAGWEALAKRNPVKYQIVTRPLYAHPPTTRIADSAETGGSATSSIGGHHG